VNGLDLFSGIGGLTLALKPWVQPVAYVEIDRYAQGVLLSRMSDGALPLAPIWDDVTTFGRHLLREPADIDIIYGGFPCQDISCAGNGAGLDGERSGLWFQVRRLAEEIRPKFVFLENVPAIRTRGLDVVVEGLAGLGYDCRWDTLSAEAVGAPHKRNRWWLLARRADSQSVGRGEGWPEHEVWGGRDASPNMGGEVADPHGARLEERESWDSGQQPSPFGEGWWKSEPALDRVVNGLPHRVDRIKGLGNAVVPAQAREAFMRLMGLKR
jgi:DNA (cytosine-5)-methyltransferase 1